MTNSSTVAKIPAAMNPRGGEITRLATCLPSADHLTPSRPCAAAMPAPQRPPIRACVELLGRPRYQVMRFHVIAPMRAESTTTRPGLMASVPAMVLETLAWKNATVTTAQRRIAASGILDRDRLHHVRGVLAGVHGGFEQVVDVLPFDELGNVLDTGEEIADRDPNHAVALVLEPVYLGAMRLELGETFEVLERGRDLDSCFSQGLAHLLRRVGDRLDAVEIDFVRGLLRQVDDIVEARREEEDVLRLERCRKRVVDEVVDLMGRVVAIVLEIAQAGVAAPPLEQRLAELAQRFADDGALLVEELEQPAPEGYGRESHRHLRARAVTSARC